MPFTQTRTFISLPRIRLSSEAIGWAAMCVMLLATATYYSFAKELSAALTPSSLLFLSEFLTAIFILLSFGFFPVMRSLAQLSRRQTVALLILSLSSGFLAPTFLYWGLRSTSAVNGTLFGNTEMLFFLLLSIAFLRERIHRRHIVSLCIMALGIIVLSLRGFSEEFRLYPGDALLILSSLSYSVGDLLFRKELHAFDTSAIVLVRSAVAMAGCVLVALLAPASIVAEVRAFPIALLPILFGFAFFSRFINILCFYQTIDRLPVSTVSVLSNLSILFSVAFASWFLAEPILSYQILGGGLIIAGAVILEVAGRHPTEAHHIAHLRQRHAHRV